jgi:hypothetical protein
MSYDVRNRNQVEAIAGQLFTLADMHFEGRLAAVMYRARKPYDWTPELDGRKKEMKELLAAESAMLDAIEKYDRARAAAIARVASDREAEKAARRAEIEARRAGSPA